jgi:hypothetical protein
MTIIEPHIHMLSRTTDEYQAMYRAGIRACVEPSFWLGTNRRYAGSFFDYFRLILEFETVRAARFGIDHFCAIAMNPKEADDRGLADEVIDGLDEYLDHPRCVAMGEVGLNLNTPNEEYAMIRQLRMAEERKMPVILHAPAIENKVYPLGTRFRTGPESLATLMFSRQESAQLASSTEVCVEAPDKQSDSRVLRLIAGTVKTSLRENLPEGSFSICTPNAVSKNVEGRGEYTLFTDAVTETLQIATITGAARIEGPQYHIPALRAANTVNIQTSVDRSFSRLTSVSGDFVIILNKGEEEPVNYGMSPKAVVKIWRENAPVGGRPVIAALVVSPTGIAKHRFAYAEGRSGVATGELVQPGAEEDEDLPVLLSKDSEKEKKEEEAEKNEASTEQ